MPTPQKKKKKRRFKNLYLINFKTQLCKNFMSQGKCKYGQLCNFAHGVSELQRSKSKQDKNFRPCKSYHLSGYCSNGSKCQYLHNEVIFSDERKESFITNPLHVFFVHKRYQNSYSSRLQMIKVDSEQSDRPEAVNRMIVNPSNVCRLPIFSSISKIHKLICQEKLSRSRRRRRNKVRDEYSKNRRIDRY